MWMCVSMIILFPVCFQQKYTSHESQVTSHESQVTSHESRVSGVYFVPDQPCSDRSMVTPSGPLNLTSMLPRFAISSTPG